MNSGHHDAAEILSQKYYFLCQEFKEEPFEPLLDVELLTRYISDAAPGDALFTFMQNEINQGFLLGRIMARMMADLELAEHDDEDDADETF